VTLEDRN